MAPTDSSLVDQLKATVDKLESRIMQLESRLAGNSSSSNSASGDGMRMILIGPPGAGTSTFPPRIVQLAPSHWKNLAILTRVLLVDRQGHPGPEDQGEVQLLPSRYRRHAARAGRRQDRPGPSG